MGICGGKENQDGEFVDALKRLKREKQRQNLRHHPNFYFNLLVNYRLVSLCWLFGTHAVWVKVLHLS